MKSRGPREHLGRWDSPEAEAHFRALEDELWLDACAEQPTARDVPTAYGTTHAYHWPGTGEPVLFLHGATGTSVMWGPYIAPLLGRDAYALDTLGDVGRSRQTVAVREAAELGGWLDQSLAGLGLDRVHVVGTSYGGYLALLLALRHPESVRSLTLVEPGGIAPLRLGRFLLWGAACLVASLLPGRLRSAAGRALRMPALDDKRLLRWAFYGQRHHRVRLLPTDPLTDDQLRSLATPVLLLVGEKTEVHDGRAVLARASDLLPDIEAEMVAGAGHGLPISHIDHVVARMTAFLAAHDVTSPSGG